MKFTCERCGKRFASVDEPSAGRVYRIRCKCGNIIHITAPHVDGDAAKRPGGVPPLDRPRISGATTSSAGVPSPRPAISAGDATSRVHMASPTRVADPAVPRRTVPAVRAQTGTKPFRTAIGTQPAPAPRTGAVPAARTRSATDPERTPAGVPAPPGQNATGSRQIPVHVTESSTAPHPEATPVDDLGLYSEPPVADLEFTFPAAAPSLTRTPSSPLPTPPPVPVEPTAEVSFPPPLDPFAAVGSPDAPPADDPFAAAAAHAAKAELFDTSAPVVTRGPTSPTGGAEQRPPEEADESVDLSISEQYALPKPGRKRSRLLPRIAGAVAVLAIAGAGAVYYLTLEGEDVHPGRQGPVAAIPPPPPAPPPSATAPSPPPPVADAPTPPSLPPPAATAPAPPPVADAPTPPPAPPPVAAAPAPPPKAAPPPSPPAPSKVASTRASKPPPEKPARTPAPERKDAAVAAKEPTDEKPDPPLAPPPAPAPPARAAAPAPPPPVAAAPEPPPAPRKQSQGLDPAVMQSVIARNRPSFDVCVDRAIQDPVTSSYAGRRAALLLLIAPTGKAEAALEDADLDASPFGACLRRVAAKMSFPTFQGDEVGARIVLVLGKAD